MAGGSLLVLFDQLKNVKFSLFSMWVWNNIWRVCVRIMKIEPFYLLVWYCSVALVFGNFLIWELL